MANPATVGVLVGSLRRDSLNLKMAHAAISVAPPSLAFDIVPIGDLPLYNADLETADPPAAWTSFRQKIRALDALLFVTPEYNRSVPAALKNALDVGSRPGGKSVWSAKPCAVISVTPGMLGAFGANHHLRQSLMTLNMPAMPTPEAYIGNAAGLFDEHGALTNPSTRELLTKFMSAFAHWVDRHVAA